MVPSGGSEGASVPCLFPGIRGQPGILGAPWLVDVSLQPLPPSSHPFSVCLCAFFSVSSRTPTIGVKPLPNPGRPHLSIFTLITTAETLTPDKVTVKVVTGHVF